MSFVHLHTHSNYSLREGAAPVRSLAESCAAFKMDTLALTDHDGVYGAVRFTLACQQAGVRPILGAEIEWGEGYHVTLLAQTKTGWSNLCQLITKMHLQQRSQSLAPGERPRTTFNEIANHSEGLMALSGCDRGEVPWKASIKQMDLAEQATARWLNVFGRDRFAIEITNHLLKDDPLRIQALGEIAKKFKLKQAATNNVHYTHRADARVHDVMECIRKIVPLAKNTVPRRNSEYFLKSSEEMQMLHTKEAIRGAIQIAESCEYQLPLGSFHFPDPATEEGLSSTGVLARRCYEGLKAKTKITKGVQDRLQYELQMIRKAGFCGYFVLVAEIVNHIKHRMGIRCSCRGSAAGALVTYALGISDVDPIRYNLAFERFMNEYRREIPDIDIDVESARREDVNTYILNKYPGRSAMVAMMDTFRARGALREVGKALGLAQTEIDSLAKAFPHLSAGSIGHAIEGLPEVKAMNLPASKLDILFDLATQLDSYPRHLAMHPSGVILSDENLKHLMPMQRSFEGFLMSQFDKDDVETLGLAKLDVLGVRMFSSFAHCIDEIERSTGTRISIDDIPRDDPQTFELIRDSRTMGCFQIESPGQRELLGKFQPERFEDLIIDISLFRPGPMKADMIRPFLDRRMGLEYPDYMHPLIKEALIETKGVIVYHEQVMRLISALTGCDLGEADKIRRSLGGGLGDEDDMRPGDQKHNDALGQEVIEKAIKRGFKEQDAAKIWKEVASFAAFGFCKAHASAFAVPTYQSAWLKTHFPAEFYCGVLTHDPGMYPRRAILADARSHGVPILPVDVNASLEMYHSEPIEDGKLAIRLALQDISGIASTEIRSIIEGRPWKSFKDFCRRTQVSRPVVEALVHCGAFDSIKGRVTRRELFWEVESNFTGRTREQTEQLSMDLFEPEQVRLPGIVDYSPEEKVAAELEVTGLDSSRHLISFYTPVLEKLGWTRAADLRKLRSGVPVVVAGVKIATQTPPTKSGKRVVFLTLEDGTGQADVTMFDEAQKKFARVVFDGWILAVKGTMRRTGAKGVSILADEVIDLAKGDDKARSRKLWFQSSGSAG